MAGACRLESGERELEEEAYKADYESNGFGEEWPGGMADRRRNSAEGLLWWPKVGT